MAARDNCDPSACPLADKRWHLDKRVPLALIVVIATQTFGAIWWVANTSSRLEQVEKQISTAPAQTERIIRLEAKLDAISGSLADLKALVRRAPERP